MHFSSGKLRAVIGDAAGWLRSNGRSRMGNRVVSKYGLAGLPLILAVGACEPPAPTMDGDRGSAVQSGSSPMAETRGRTRRTPCPAQDFKLFVKAFTESAEIQREFTVVPLQSVTLDTAAEPGPSPIMEMIAAPRFPIVPDARKQAREGLRQRWEVRPDGEAELKLLNGDTGLQIRYLFRQSDCWHLYRVDDGSL